MENIRRLFYNSDSNIIRSTASASVSASSRSGVIEDRRQKTQRNSDQSVCEVDATTSSEKEILSYSKCSRTTPFRNHSSIPLRSKSSIYLMLKDVRYYFHHPYTRLFTASTVMMVNFLFYAQDPTNHSVVKTTLPIVGNAFSFMFFKYPLSTWSILKVAMWLMSIIFGIVFGKYIIHELVFNYFMRLHMFSNNKGSYMTSFICVVLSLFSFSFVYNMLISLCIESNEPYLIDSQIDMEYRHFSEFNQTCTWFGDFITAYMVTDVMLQEKLYPAYCRRLRQWWVVKNHRVTVFWLLLVFASLGVVGVIVGKDEDSMWDRSEIDYTFNNEIWRAFLSASILVMDLSIVMQDWDFPLYVNPLKIKLPGLNIAHIDFKILKRINIRMTGKWFNYGILFFITVLDLNNWATQLMYQPLNYAQYTHPDTLRIYSTKDVFSVNTPFNATVLSFAFRNSTIDPLTGELYIKADELLSARYVGSELSMKVTALIPVIITYGVFFTLIFVYGRYPKPTKENPYPNLVVKLYVRMSRRKLVPEKLVVPRTLDQDCSIHSSTVASTRESAQQFLSTPTPT